MNVIRCGVWSVTVTWMLAMLTAWPSPAGAQQILLDKPVRAGNLVLFPDLNDASTFYYVLDKARLATDASGQPQFSFLRYVESVRSGADQPEAREGEGGGILHAVVALTVSPEQIAAAQRDLQRVQPGAKIAGPVVFKSGRVGLVSAFKDEKGNLTSRVFGIGNAPLLDGEKAAISIQLTKLGSKILWESFDTAAPDISFSFEMDLTGYRSPARATIEANFDQIYRHQAFNPAVASTYLAGEIRSTFDDLRSQGAIKVTQVGGDEKMEALVTTAYNKIMELMFAPAAGSATPNVADVTASGASGNSSLLDRATRMLSQNRAAAESTNRTIRTENAKAREDAQKAGEARAREAASASEGTTEAPAGTEGAVAASTAEAKPKRGSEAPDAADASNGWGAPLAIAAPRQPHFPGETPAPAAAPAPAPPQREEVSVPEFAVLASYEMRTERRSGTFSYDLNKYTADNLTLRFDENIGDLRSLKGDAAHFRQVNLDDPLYKQRELVVMLDGLNAKDFGEYVNFATVRMRKRHAAGDESADEVRIDRNNFNHEGNQFKLLYGWKNDTDRRKWMDYETQTTWSFVGGKEVQEPWTKRSIATIGVTPPFQKRSVELQADPEAIAKAEVRSVSVKLFYRLGDAEQVKQVTLNPAKGQLSDRIDYIQPAGAFDYDYEIVWQLKGNRTVTSGRRHGNQGILFVDEVTGG
jgi:hypothetical protein